MFKKDCPPQKIILLKSLIENVLMPAPNLASVKYENLEKFPDPTPNTVPVPIIVLANTVTPSRVSFDVLYPPI